MHIPVVHYPGGELRGPIRYRRLFGSGPRPLEKEDDQVSRPHSVESNAVLTAIEITLNE